MIKGNFRDLLGIGAIVLMVVGCNSTPPPKPETSVSPGPIVSASPSVKPKAEPLKSTPSKSEPIVEPSPAPTKIAAVSGSTVPVAVYRMDAACDALVPKTEDLPKERTLEAAVGSVISRNNSADFTVSDYRVSQAGSKATIVLRLPPTAKRPFAAMSACEQMSLFGALRETIVSRSEWKIRDVEFSDGKEEIVF
jgi:hypothetical protein